MEIALPAHVVVYALGCLAVIVVIGGITWLYTFIETRVARKRERNAARDK
ncbi:MAG: hypothetical protein K6U78_10410 [Anaerolineae bacterium]|jgi:hypothetical protein|nr:hypothetical protein [Anaerolineae bacterium]